MTREDYEYILALTATLVRLGIIDYDEACRTTVSELFMVMDANHDDAAVWDMMVIGVCREYRNVYASRIR